MENLRINKLTLTNVNCFDFLEMNFSKGYNIISGTNGIGKTTILNSIGTFFKNIHAPNSVIQRINADEIGRIAVVLSSMGNNHHEHFIVDSKKPEELIYKQTSLATLSKFLIYITTKRDFSYRKLAHISSDAQRQVHDVSSSAPTGISHDETKNWIANRYLFKPHSHTWPPHQNENFEAMIKFFTMLDGRFKLSHVDTATFDVIVSTPSGDIPYELLSSGFRSSLSLLTGIMREIEFRQLGISAAKFSGLIMIDELDLHLHPTWQQSLPRILVESYPNAQIIVTSHSPYMIQAAEPNQVIALSADDMGRGQVRKLHVGKYGFKGWSVEEILEDVMGVRDSNTRIYRNLLREFDNAIDREEAPAVLRLAEELDELLHPSNELRKMIRIQAAPFAGRE